MLLKKRYLAIVLLVAALALIFVVSPDIPQKDKTASKDYITILWAQWAPADFLQQLTMDFTKESGIKVDIVQESWTCWQAHFFDEMKIKGKKYDMVIGDSQWLGRGSMGGHYVSLNKWIRENRVDESMTASSIAGYSEFPRKSGNYWAVPLEGDAMAFSYRKDLFEDPEEKEKFTATYGYDLQIPETWKELRDIAEFFYRPDKNLYGILVWTEPDYDGITMGIDAFIWGWGASLGNPETYQVKGHINSEKAVKALEYYRELNRFNNPEWTHYYLDTHASSNLPMMHGEVAMAMCYLAIAPELLDPRKNPYHDVMGFFPTPKGPGSRATSLGGQGISIVSYSKKKEFSLKFLEWFIREDVQRKWAEQGGLSCNRNVLNSREFLSASPVNRPYRESMEIVRDFWAVPEYPELLAVSQKYWSQYIRTGEPDAEEIMNIVAKEWEEIFDQAGYYRE